MKELFSEGYCLFFVCCLDSSAHTLVAFPVRHLAVTAAVPERQRQEQHIHSISFDSKHLCIQISVSEVVHVMAEHGVHMVVNILQLQHPLSEEMLMLFAGATLSRTAIVIMVQSATPSPVLRLTYTV
jgi:hypothetical protein